MGKLASFVFTLLLHFFTASLAWSEMDYAIDKSTLLAFKSSITVGPNNLLANWSVSSSSSPCDWIGVRCNTRHRRVHSLDLSNTGLKGIISPQLGNLSFLVVLDLSDNNFHGRIPEELVRLRRLRLFNLSYNDFHGQIPTWIGDLSMLEHLGFRNNSFNGVIPSSLFNLSKLEILDWNFNLIEGTIPFEVGRLEPLMIGSSTAINKGRGVYKSINVNLRTAQGAKIRVKFSDSMSRAIGAEARDFSNYCGLTLRTIVSFRDGGGSWKNVFEKYGPDMILKIKDKFEPADAITEEKFHMAISIILQNAFRNWKNNLHSHYKKFETDKDRLADPPQTISFQDWEWLLIYFKSDMFKNKSARNTINREKQMTKHTCGPRSFAEIEYATRDPTTGQPIPPDQLWEITHTRKTLDGQVIWADAHSEQLHSRMHELSQQQDQDLESDARMTSEEILATVLGERSGYVRGKGYGAEPSRKRNRPQSTDSSVVDSVRAQLQEEFEKKFEEEREKIEAERVKMEEERAKMEEEREKMQQERVQFEQRLMEQIEQRIQAQFAALMQKGQQHAPTSSSHSIGPSI